MTGRGERLFQVMAQLPEEMLLEAERDSVEENWADAPADHSVAEGDALAQNRAENDRPPERKNAKSRIGGVLKYLPVAACLCLVVTGAYYVIGNFGMKNSDSAGRSESAYDAAMDTSDAAGVAMNETDEADVTDESGSANEDSAALDSVAGPGQLPIRYDAYEGPVLMMSATGDTQALRTRRSIKADITTESVDGLGQPLMEIEDQYRIRNTSDSERTFQVVYPFVTTLNQSVETADMLLCADGEELAVSYGVGDSVSAYLKQDSRQDSTAADYERLLADVENEYQDTALEKTLDWGEEVNVYLFSDINIEGLQPSAGSAVIGLAVEDEKARVLTYGFEHDLSREDGTRYYSFFADTGEQNLMLITAGTKKEPDLGFYTNLDCEQTIEGVSCEMTRYTMTWDTALRMCAGWTVRRLQERYDSGSYAGTLPQYLSQDTLYDALAAIGPEEEEELCDALTRRYGTHNLREVYERLSGETRIVYAMSTVTVPAGETVKVTASTKKQQTAGHFRMPDAEALSGRETYSYDFFAWMTNPLNIQKTTVRLSLSEDWRIVEEDLGLKKKKSVWKAVVGKGNYRLEIANCSESNTFSDKD